MTLLKYQQKPVGDWWKIWLMITERAAGKTYAAIEFAESYMKQGLPVIYICNPRTQGFIAEEVLTKVGNGDTVYSRSKQRITHPSGGYIQFESPAYQAQTWLRLRGRTFSALVWDDIETASNTDMAIEVLETASFGLRVGENPCMMLTASDSVDTKLLEYLAKKDTTITRANSRDNAVNLSKPLREFLGI